MGKMILILIAGASILIAIGTLNLNRVHVAVTGDAIDEYNYTQAKNYAQSGIEYAINKLSVNPSWAGENNKSTSNGLVSIIVDSTASKYYRGANTGLTRGRLITAIGSIGGKTDTVRAVVQLQNPAGGSNVPGFMTYAIATGNNISMNGNVNIQDDNNPQWNANVHTNANFSMNGNNSIEGFLSYTGSAHSNPGWRLDNNITPNQNPESLPNRSQVETIAIPTFNPDDYLDVATQVFPSNKSYSGSISLGTEDNPQIIYVGGDLNISGNVSGYGVFIVKGNININGNVSITGQNPNHSNVGFYTQGDLNANGNVTLKGQILTGGNANLNGNVKVYGSVTSHGTVNFGGNINVYYKPANESLTNPFWAGQSPGGSGSTRPQIISYYN